MTQTQSTSNAWSAIGGQRRGRIIVGVLALVIFAGYTWQSFLIPFGSMSQPGAGMFPRVVGFAAIAISLVVIGEGMFARVPGEGVDLPRGFELRQVVLFFGSTALFAMTLPILGQYIGGTLYSFALMSFLGKRKPGWLGWAKLVAYALVIGVGVPWVFIHVLQLDLPEGIILPPELF
jgi:putative tricarboxylic transport membrane protein